jgi:hypothetical protein
MPASFRPPRSGDQYVSQILDRVENLIAQGFWEGLSSTRVKSWLANFRNDDDRYFVACVLDALVYRSNGQTVALAKQLFQRSLVDLVRLDPLPSPLPNGWLDDLRQDSLEPGVRLVAVHHPEDPPTKSAFLIARMLKRDLGLKERWILRQDEFASAVASGINQFVFIDDFLGTGQQFLEFGQNIGLQAAIASLYCIYAPLVAHSFGVRILRKSVPGLRIASAERLSEENNIFHATSACFDDGINTPSVAEAFYYDLLPRLNIPLMGQDRLGYGGLGVTFAFQHAAPDNSLPILWWNKTSTFHPLFDR